MTPPLVGMVPWPADITERYRARGYWTGETLGSAFDRSVGRWQRDLTADQLRDVEDEAGELLAELAYS